MFISTLCYVVDLIAIGVFHNFRYGNINVGFADANMNVIPLKSCIAIHRLYQKFMVQVFDKSFFPDTEPTVPDGFWRCLIEFFIEIYLKN